MKQILFVILLLMVSSCGQSEVERLREQVAVLEVWIVAEVDDLFMLVYTKLYLEFLQPLEIIKPIELTDGFQYLTKQVPLFVAQLLIKYRERRVCITDTSLACL